MQLTNHKLNAKSTRLVFMIKMTNNQYTLFIVYVTFFSSISGQVANRQPLGTMRVGFLQSGVDAHPTTQLAVSMQQLQLQIIIRWSNPCLIHQLTPNWQDVHALQHVDKISQLQLCRCHMRAWQPVTNVCH